MYIEYQFDPVDQPRACVKVDLNRKTDGAVYDENAPAWTQLAYQQCQNCPLNGKTQRYCPAALDVHVLLGALPAMTGQRKIAVRVISTQREYFKHVPVEDAVRSLLGLVMASSACPVFGLLKPLSHHHLPFASVEEQTVRMVSFYLLKQYFNQKQGQPSDWQLTALRQHFKTLQLVNHAFWQRIQGHIANPANARALLSFFTLSGNLSTSLDTWLDQVYQQDFNIADPTTRGTA